MRRTSCSVVSGETASRALALSLKAGAARGHPWEVGRLASPACSRPFALTGLPWSRSSSLLLARVFV